MRLLRDKKPPRALGLAAAALSLGLVAAACGTAGTGGEGGGGGGGGGQSEPLTIGYINWNEDVATTFLWKHILEQRGYNVELKQLGVAPLFTSLARGDIDMFLDTWLPSTHEKYWKRFGGDLTKIAQWYDGASLDLAVPKYMNIDSIGQLNSVAGKLDGKITGIGPGAGETGIIKNQIMPAYNLEDKLTYQTSSSTAMLASLKKATGNNEPIVVALWHPHWAYEAFPIKDLEDPKNAWPGEEKLYVSAPKGFSQDWPKIAKWMENYKLTDEQLSSLSNQVVNKAGDSNEAKQQAAAKWAQQNQDLIQSWVGSSG